MYTTRTQNGFDGTSELYTVVLGEIHEIHTTTLSYVVYVRTRCIRSKFDEERYFK